ncbi:MAG: hypothetical protein HY608_07900 [Planctomycetes bacterium]|nr:hypothetical protein [Planctomycetota bacterium]
MTEAISIRHLTVGALLGALAVLLCSGTSLAGLGSAGASNPDGPQILTAGVKSPGSVTDSLLLVDPTEYALVTYTLDPTNRLPVLNALRYYGWDLLLRSYPSAAYLPEGADNATYREPEVKWVARAGQNSSHGIRKHLELFLRAHHRLTQAEGNPKTPEDVQGEQLRGSAGHTALQTLVTGSIAEFVLLDTALKRICWYAVESDRILFLSARRYDYDLTLATAWPHSFSERGLAIHSRDRGDMANPNSDFWPVQYVHKMIDSKGETVPGTTPAGPGGGGGQGTVNEWGEYTDDGVPE